MQTLFIHAKHVNADGTQDTFCSVECEAKDVPLPHHMAGLQFTRTGYGSRIPTRALIKFNGKWRRVYCRIYSNIGTCFIGKLSATGEQLIVRG